MKLFRWYIVKFVGLFVPHLFEDQKVLSMPFTASIPTDVRCIVGVRKVMPTSTIPKIETRYIYRSPTPTPAWAVLFSPIRPGEIYLPLYRPWVEWQIHIYTCKRSRVYCQNMWCHFCLYGLAFFTIHRHSIFEGLSIGIENVGIPMQSLRGDIPWNENYAFWADFKTVAKGLRQLERSTALTARAKSR